MIHAGRHPPSSAFRLLCGGWLSVIGSLLLLAVLGTLTLYSVHRGFTPDITVALLAMGAAGVSGVAFATARNVTAKRIDWILWAAWTVLLFPAAWLGIFWGLVFRARLILGYWPYPRTGNPFDGTYEYPLDPKVMPLHHFAVLFGALIVGALTLLAPALVGGSVWRYRMRMFWPTFLFLVSTGLFWVVLLLDPGQFWEWYLD